MGQELVPGQGQPVAVAKGSERREESLLDRRRVKPVNEAAGGGGVGAEILGPQEAVDQVAAAALPAIKHRRRLVEKQAFDGAGHQAHQGAGMGHQPLGDETRPGLGQKIVDGPRIGPATVGPPA